MRRSRLSSALLALTLAQSTPSGAAASLAGMTFVVDAGHGARYPDGAPLNVGAVGPDGVQEARVALAVAEDLAGLLKREGARVVLTRSYAHPYRVGTNLRKDNRARAALANRLSATAFISIHADSAIDRDQRGISVFWLHPNSARLARNVRAALAPLGLGEAAFHPRELAVTEEARVPAVLVELGFVSNPSQERLLASPAFEDREAAALHEALSETFAR